MTTKLASGLLSTLCMAAIGIFQYSGLNKLTSHSRNGAVQNHYANEEQTVEQLKILKNIPSFGFRNSIANWSFLSFLQYFGDENARNISDYSISPEYLSAVLSHDPYYKDFYLFLSESTTFYAGMPDKTVELMTEGLSYLNENRADDSYYIWRYKGADELLFLNEANAAQQSFEMAATWAEESSEENSQFMASLSRQTASFLASDPDSTQAKIGAWSSILITSRDEQTQDRAVEGIRSLGGDVLFSEDGGLSIKYPDTAQEEVSEAESSI